MEETSIPLGNSHGFNLLAPMTAEPATLWPRLMAGVYDIFLIGALLFLGTGLAVVVTGGDAVAAGSWWFRAYLLLLAGGFYCWFWTHGGQTLGMRAWRLMVVDTSGKPIGWSHAALRYVCALLSWLSLIGVLWCLVDSERRCLHDLASGTRVGRLPKK